MAIAKQRGKLIFRKAERELLRLASGERNDGGRAEAVHSFRTTTRRLQTLLEQVLDNRDHNQKKLLKVLNRIRKSAGKVRDIDAQLGALRSLKVPLEPRRKTQLVQGLLEIRAQHEAVLGKLLKKSEIREVEKRLKRAAKDVRWESKRDPLVVAKQILAGVDLASRPADEKTLHRYRIAVKQARYAAEFAPDSPEATRFIAQLKRLQDALGNWHDWLTLTHTAVERFGDVTQSSLVAALRGVTRGKFRQAVAAVSAAQAARTTIRGKRTEITRKQAAKKPSASRQSGVAAA